MLTNPTREGAPSIGPVPIRDLGTYKYEFQEENLFLPEIYVVVPTV